MRELQNLIVWECGQVSDILRLFGDPREVATAEKELRVSPEAPSRFNEAVHNLREAEAGQPVELSFLIQMAEDLLDAILVHFVHIRLHWGSDAELSKTPCRKECECFQHVQIRVGLAAIDI